jgi:uncharacterized membrane protein YesL
VAKMIKCIQKIKDRIVDSINWMVSFIKDVINEEEFLVAYIMILAALGVFIGSILLIAAIISLTYNYPMLLVFFATPALLIWYMKRKNNKKDKQ